MPDRSRVRGFTLVEVLVVMALIVIIGAFGLLVSMQTFRGSSFRSDRDLLVAALQRARAESMSNVCIGTCTDGGPHGVEILPSTYVVFQGATYASRDTSADAIFSSSPGTTRVGLSEVVFTQLSGAASAGTITLTGTNESSVITIGSDGQISWTN